MSDTAHLEELCPDGPQFQGMLITWGLHGTKGERLAQLAEARVPSMHTTTGQS